MTRRHFYVVVLVPAIWAALQSMTACNKQALGQLCSTDNNNDDCQDGLVCVRGNQQNSDICCDPNNLASCPMGTGTGGAGGGSSSTTSSTSGAGGKGGSGGSSSSASSSASSSSSSSSSSGGGHGGHGGASGGAGGKGSGGKGGKGGA